MRDAKMRNLHNFLNLFCHSQKQSKKQNLEMHKVGILSQSTMRREKR